MCGGLCPHNDIPHLCLVCTQTDPALRVRAEVWRRELVAARALAAHMDDGGRVAARRAVQLESALRAFVEGYECKHWTGDAWPLWRAWRAAKRILEEE